VAAVYRASTTSSLLRPGRGAEVRGYDVCTGHLLLGLLRDEDNVAHHVLKDLGGGVEAVRREVERQLRRVQRKPTQEMTLTPRSKKAIDLAYDEARELGNDYIGTEHLLLGLIREREGLAGRVLSKLGITVEAVRSRVAALHESGPTESAATRHALSDFDKALVRLAAALAAGDLELTRQAAGKLRAAGASSAQVSELCELVAGLTKEDISHLIQACQDVMDEESD